MTPRFSQLANWLAWLETLHPQAIDLGLTRIYRVALKLQLLQSATHVSHSHSGALHSLDSRVISVAGTNGKGSCIKVLEQCLLLQGYSVGAYTSPHIHHYCERICINGEPVSEQLVCDAFSAIDEARGDISLTYFEFGTLAALWIFVHEKVSYVLLEVGLGGRLDAVNIVDADVAIITSIAVDHEEWLGSDRNNIAKEKLGIARKQCPVIFTETDLTPSMIAFAEAHELSHIIHRTFFLEISGAENKIQWKPSVHEKAIIFTSPNLPINSVMAALQALWVLELLPSADVLERALPHFSLVGRFELQEVRHKNIIFDVAHNPAAAIMLAKKLDDSKQQNQQTFAVFMAMADKDVAQIISSLSHTFTHWYCGKLLENERAISQDLLGQALACHEQLYSQCGNIEQAFERALNDAEDHDRIVVFGSFFTVAAIQQYLRRLTE